MEKKKEDDFENWPRIKKVQTGIRKKFHSQLFTKFAKALNLYNLLKENDSVAIYVESEPRSVLLAFMFQEILRHGKFDFSVRWFLNEKDMSAESKKEIEDVFVAASLSYERLELSKDIKTYAEHALEAGCNLVADMTCYDEATAVFLSNMINNACIKACMPREEICGITVIRPLYNVSREEIIHFSKYCGFESLSLDDSLRWVNDTKIQDTMELIAKLKENNKFADSNIFAAMENVNLNTVIGYRKDKENKSFLDWYDDYTQELYVVGQDS